MGSLFRRRKGGFEPRRLPVLIPRSPQGEGFSFEPLREEVVDECIDSMIKAMPNMRFNRERLRGGLLLPSSLTLVARHEGAIVGVISGTVYQTPNPPPMIVLIVILDEKSGERGLGGHMIDEFLKATQKRAPKASFVDVSLPTSDTSSIAICSLKGFAVEGFVRRGFNPSFTREGSRDLVILRRWFTATRPANTA